MSLVLDTGAMKYRENLSQPWRPLVIKAGMNWESMADTYDPDNGTYEVGQYVLEEGMMYRCISEITTPETWTPAHWTSVNVGDELSSFIIISDDQPTENSNKIWIAETTAPFGVQVPTMDDHNALGNTLTSFDAKVFGNLSLAGINNTGSTILKGTFFYNNGDLVRAKQDISNNASISSTNSEIVTAGSLNLINKDLQKEALTVTFPSAKVQSGVWAEHVGNIVQVRFVFQPTSEVSSYEVFATIDPAFAPSSTLYFPATRGGYTQFELLPNGNLRHDGAFSGWTYGIVTYFI